MADPKSCSKDYAHIEEELIEQALKIKRNLTPEHWCVLTDRMQEWWGKRYETALYAEHNLELDH